MKKHVLIICFLVSSIGVRSQTVRVETTTCSNIPLISFKVSNLLALLQMSYAQFSAEMARSNYRKNSELEEGCYINENGPAGSPYWVICKNPGEVTMIWTNNVCNMDSNMKDELERYFVRSAGKVSVYMIKVNSDVLTVYLSISGDSGSVRLSK